MKLDQFLNKKHYLYLFAQELNWSIFEEKMGSYYHDSEEKVQVPIRFLVGLYHLKGSYHVNDDLVEERFLENPYWQYFCGLETFQHSFPYNPSVLFKWRKQIKANGLTEFLEKAGIHTEEGEEQNPPNQPFSEQPAIAKPKTTRTNLYQKTRQALFQRLKAESVKLKKSNAQNGKGELEKFVEGVEQTLERIDQSVYKIQRFTTDAAHEIRTPLTTIRGELEFLQRYPDKFNETSLEPVLEEISRLNSLCSRLLFLSRLDEEVLPVKNSQLSLEQLLQKILEQVNPLADSEEIKIIYKEKSSVTIPADEGVMSQVLLNLLDNAIRYTPAGGFITVILEKQNAMAKITIQDTGSGIAPEHLPHIFERFYRVPEEESKVSSGSGLGLAIVKEVIEFQGGSIKATSEPEKGTTFEILLPISKAK